MGVCLAADGPGTNRKKGDHHEKTRPVVSASGPGPAGGLRPGGGGPHTRAPPHGRGKPNACPTLPSPTPEPPDHGDPADFYQFLSEVNAARKAITTQEEPIDISPYTPDFHEQNHTFTEAEMKRLTTRHGPEADLTKDDLLADADTFFTLLQTTYGAYYYFGGDDTFSPSGTR